MPTLELVPPLETLPERILNAGDFLARQGDNPGAVFILISGSIEVVRDGKTLCKYRTPGTFFGEVAVLTGESSIVCFRAVEESAVRVVEDFRAYIGNDPAALWQLAESLAERLGDMDHSFARAQEKIDSLIAGSAAESRAPRELKQQIADAWENVNEFMRRPIF